MPPCSLGGRTTAGRRLLWWPGTCGCLGVRQWRERRRAGGGWSVVWPAAGRLVGAGVAEAASSVPAWPHAVDEARGVVAPAGGADGGRARGADRGAGVRRGLAGVLPGGSHLR